MGPPPLAGHFSVEDAARRLRRYRYAVERMMRAMGGWIALTPEISAKLLLGRHVWDNAQHADAFGRRLPELRARSQESEPASAGMVSLLDLLESAEAPEQTVERLTGVYRVLKPHLVATYLDHLGRANPVYEPPTRVILERAVEDERRHVGAGETVLRHLVRTERARARAAAWQARLEGLLARAGGVAGDGRIGLALALGTPSAEGEEFVRLEELGPRWPIPEDLAGAIKELGEGLVAADTARVRAWLAPSVALAEGADSPVRDARVNEWRVVAFACIGAQRAVKLRLEGPGAAVVALTRWARRESGWRVEAFAVDRAEPVVSA